MNILCHAEISQVLGNTGMHERDLARIFEKGLAAVAPVRPNAQAEFPAINAWEDETSITITIEAELAGFKVDDVEVHVTGGNQLSIKGERRPPQVEGHWHRKERGFGQFARLVTLPFEVDANNVEARMRNGVLNIHLQKKTNSRSRKIEVRVV